MVIIQGQRGDLRRLMAELQIGSTATVVYTVNAQTGFVQRVYVLNKDWVLDLSNDVDEATFLSDFPRAVRVRAITTAP